MLSIFDLPLRMGLFWYPFAFTFGVGALVVPEILFYPPKPKEVASAR